MSDNVDAMIAGVLCAVEGESHADTVEALTTVLSQAIADMSNTAEMAEKYAVALSEALARDIRKNWPLVTERRRAQ